MAFTEDLTEFFSTDDFAVEAVFTKTDLSQITVNVIFTDESDSNSVFEHAIEHEAAYLTAVAADVADIVQDNEVVVNSVTYLVKRIEKDGISVKNLYLKKKRS